MVIELCEILMIGSWGVTLHIDPGTGGADGTLQEILGAGLV